MGTTANAKLPYPEGTDLVMDGDDAIEDLAKALDTNTLIRLSTKPTAADSDASYPFGWSFFYLTGTDSAAGGWPAGVYWRAFTFRVSNGNAFQYLVRASPSTPAFLLRNYASGQWSPWIGNGPYGRASGIVSFGTVSAGSSKSATVTFPAERFTATPVILASAISGSPHGRNASSSAGTSSGCNIYFGNWGSSDFPDAQAYWIAEQASSSSGVGLMAARTLAAEPVPDVTVTCPNEDCENYDIPIAIASTWDDDDGNAHPVDLVICGACGTNITDTMTPIGGE